MNIFIQWQASISDAYLTDTHPYFPFIELNISLLPQGSLASIPNKNLIISANLLQLIIGMLFIKLNALVAKLMGNFTEIRIISSDH